MLTLRMGSAKHATMLPEPTPLPADLSAALVRARAVLERADWHGLEGEIARTGEEDPLANVDDPDLAAVIAAKMADRHDTPPDRIAQPAEAALLVALDKAEPSIATARAHGDGAAALDAIVPLAGPVEDLLAQLAFDQDDTVTQRRHFELLDRFLAAVHNAQAIQVG